MDFSKLDSANPLRFNLVLKDLSLPIFYVPFGLSKLITVKRSETIEGCLFDFEHHSPVLLSFVGYFKNNFLQNFKRIFRTFLPWLAIDICKLK